MIQRIKLILKCFDPDIRGIGINLKFHSKFQNREITLIFHVYNVNIVDSSDQNFRNDISNHQND